MKLHFTKMQGLGNDFVVIDSVSQDIQLDKDLIKKIADRHYGVGCDQVLLIAPPRSLEEDFFYRIFNSNGGEVEQCGNGVRCLAKFIYEHQFSAKKIIKIATIKTKMEVILCDDGMVKVNMGEPIFDTEKWLFKEGIEFVILSMGNPHAVTYVDKIDEAPVNSVGAQVSTHSDFPLQTNVGFMQIQNRHQITLRVYERHEGETLACGSGACAAVAAGILQGKLDEVVEVYLPGGMLKIEWKGKGHPLWMSGPAKKVFVGVYDSDDAASSI